MTTIKTFIKPTQTLKLAILALSFGSTLAVAGDMNPERLISSVRPGDKIVMFNKPNSDAPVTAESKAIEFSERFTGSGVFAATFVKGKKFDGNTFFNADNTDAILAQYAACTLTVITEPLARVQTVASDDVPKIRVMNNIKNQKLTLTLKSEARFSSGLNSPDVTMVDFDLVPVKLAEGTLDRIRCHFNKPVHIVKNEFKVSSMIAAFKDHASFQIPDPLSPRPQTGQ